MPYFSAVIPSFNAAATIRETLAGLQAQTCADWEAVVVDDGSMDETRTLVRAAAAADARIRLVRNPGKGPSAARNFGALEHACGDVIAFCDADDIWHRDKLSQLRASFRQGAVDGAYGRIGFFRANPANARVFSTVPVQDLTIAMLLGENPVCTMSNFAVRRRVFAATGGFDEAMVHNEDLEWLIRLVGGGARVSGIDSLHTYYRTSVEGLSADLEAMRSGREQAIATAAGFGVVPSATSHAIHHRYLARRALRLNGAPAFALKQAASGILKSPRGFFSPFRRGGLTLAGSLLAPFLPRPLRRNLFSR
ncbi:glycosyltransferase [Leisingera daeponensis]|uniref:Glycosyltransferase n=1 Tax=Leisingera daeponensis TaxID=405746 RepID=A0ABS7NM87_9RHOB|nr:glycosyltransferase family 2 protein [Leisingera daeponensis]MBY6142292.1 glycosyltransferase [Leisingera daeponensis]